MTSSNSFDSKLFSMASAAGWRSRRRRTRLNRSTSWSPWSRTAIAICRLRSSAIAGVDGCGDHLVARSTWGQDRPGILVLSHLDTVHPDGFIERLPFKVEGDSAFGPGIYDMKGGAYIAYHAFRAALRRRRSFAARHHPSVRLRRGDRQPDLARADRGRRTQGQIRAGDRARARRRQDRHRPQGRRAFRSFHQGRARACRHAAPRRPQRDPRARQRHPDAGSHERSGSAASPSMSAWSRGGTQPNVIAGGGLCRSRPARAELRGRRRIRSARSSG